MNMVLWSIGIGVALLLLVYGIGVWGNRARRPVILRALAATPEGLCGPELRKSCQLGLGVYDTLAGLEDDGLISRRFDHFVGGGSTPDARTSGSGLSIYRYSLTDKGKDIARTL